MQRPFLRDLGRRATRNGSSWKRGDLRGCAGQLELTLHHKPDALRAAGRGRALQACRQGSPAASGCDATFMAKPCSRSRRQGLHLHVQPAGRLGRQCLRQRGSGRRRRCSATRSRSMKAPLAESMAIFAPSRPLPPLGQASALTSTRRGALSAKRRLVASAANSAPIAWQGIGVPAPAKARLSCRLGAGHAGRNRSGLWPASRRATL